MKGAPMSTITILSDVTAEAIHAVLRDRLPPHYRITPAMASSGFATDIPDSANALLVKGRWLARANVHVIPGAGSTQIHVTPGATYPGLIHLADRIGIVRKVQHVLAESAEITGPKQAQNTTAEH